jgi:mannan endo-1,4-beta-mannosidase
MTRASFLSLAALGPLAAVAGSSLFAAPTAAAAALPATPGRHLTRTGTTLSTGGTATRLSGVNAYWLGLDDNAGGSPGTFPSQAKITAAFIGMRQLGTTLVRAHTIGISAGTPMSYLTGYSGATPRYSDANMAAADWAVHQAGLHGIHLMCPLTDEWNYYHGGAWWFVHEAYTQNPAGLTDVDGSVRDDPANRQFFGDSTAQLRIRALFTDYLMRWLNHVNTYTGIAYKDDPTIAIVETGNEIYPATAEWTADIAATIKSIAPAKLVADGAAASGLPVSAMPGLGCPDVDIVGSHYYPNTGAPAYGPAPVMTAAAQLAADVRAAAGAGKAFVIGEYPWTRPDIASWWSTVAGQPQIAADLAWSFIPNLDSGAPEQHGGPFGCDDYPVHRPYAGTHEQVSAPALARHIAAMSGVAPTGGAGTDPLPPAPTNLIRSAAAAAAADATLLIAGGATLANDRTVSHSGGTSVRATVTASGYPYVYLGDPVDAGAVVTAGRTFTASLWVRPAADQRFSAHLSWFTAGGGYLSGSDGSVVSCPAGTWTRLTWTTSAPAQAAYAVPQIDAQNAMIAAETFSVDDFGIAAGSTPAT